MESARRDSLRSRGGRTDGEREAWLDRLSAGLLDGAGPAVVLLSGPRGSGRSAFCETLVERARAQGGEVALWPLDLEGYEPDFRQGLRNLLTYLADEEERAGRPPRRDAAEAIAARIETLEAGDWSAAALALWFALDEPPERLGALLEGPGGVDALRRVLADVASRRRLVIHLRDESGTVRAELVAELVARAVESPHVLLAVSCAPGSETSAVLPADAPAGEPARLELAPLRPAELGDLYQGRLAELIAAHPRGATLRDFLILAALCGRDVPAELLLARLGLIPEVASELTDLIDDELVDEIGMLADLEFRHPGFPDLNVYRFTDPALPAVLLEPLADEEVRMRAESLLRFLQERLPVRNRAAARLHLAVAAHAGGRAHEPYARLLSWWCGASEAAELERRVERELAAGEVDPEAVFELVWRSRGGWPPYRILAVLDGYRQGALERPGYAPPPDRRLLVHGMRAELLFAMGRHEEALADAERAVALSPPDSLARARSLNIQGAVGLHLGRPAPELLEQAVDLYRRHLGPTHPVTLTATANLARTLTAQGRPAEARALLEEVVDVQTLLHGEEHLDTLTALRSLAVALREQGQPEASRELLERVLEAQRRVLGEGHPETLKTVALIDGTEGPSSGRVSPGYRARNPGSA